MPLIVQLFVMEDPLRFWTWIFFALYTGVMLICGTLGMRRVRGSDDFATARGSYGPLYLALALTATTASGATFLGLPGIIYTYGVSGIWLAFAYPVGVYLGVLICFRVVSRAGQTMGCRSIPEFLGDRYQSPVLRVLVSLFSLMLLFYLAGQLVSGTVMFKTMLGVSPIWALGITTVILVIYVAFGGAHADILTDGIQGAIMLILAGAVGVLFFLGYTVAGGFTGMLDTIAALDRKTVQPLNQANPVVGSWWALFSILIAHLPMGMLPHIGNKLWALEDGASRKKFLLLSFAFGMLLPAIGLGGILCRALVGDELLSKDNEAIPVLFVHIFPAWLAAFAGAGILAAVMSTADGLVVSTSQIFANDLYRRTLAPRLHPEASDESIDRIALKISRQATLVVLIAALALAWACLDQNIALLVWVGVGGMMAALSGPLVLGVLWRGVTKAGAMAGFITGAIVFVVLKMGLVGGDWSQGNWFTGPVQWLEQQKVNPYSCAAIGEIASVLVTTIVSWFTPRLPRTLLTQVFGEEVPTAK